MREFWKVALFGLFGALVWAGCPDSGVGNDNGDADLLIQTVLNPQLAVLGQTVTVSCPVFDQLGTLQDRETRFVVTPEITPVGDTITPSVAGTYAVRCMTVDGGLEDKTPAVLFVIHPDDIDKVVVETTLAKAQAAINEDVDVACSIRFEGTEVSGLETAVTATPTAGLIVDDHTVHGTKDEDYAIRCAVVGTDFIDQTPAILVVGEGGQKPAIVTARLDFSEVKAGDKVGVACEVTGDKGTPMKNVAAHVEAPNGVGLNGFMLTAQQVGSFDIYCRLDDESGPAVNEVPDTLTVTAGTPVTVEAWAEPDKAVYVPGDVVRIKWQGIDAFQNPVPAPAGTVVAPIEGVKTLEPARFELLSNGYRTFTVSLDDKPSVNTQVKLTVDGDGPVITVTSPARGETFDGDGQVQVAGKVADAFGGVDSLQINGYDVTPAPDGSFAFEVSSIHGANPLVIVATDVHGNVENVVQAWYYSTSFVTADKAQPDEAWIDDSVRVWLSQQLIDDGDHTEAQIDDLAHLLELLLNQADFAEMLGKPALFQQTLAQIDQPDWLGLGVYLSGDVNLWAEIDTVTFGTAKVSLTSHDGGLAMKANFVPDDAGAGLHVGIKVYLQLSLVATAEFDLGDGLMVPLTAFVEPKPTLWTTSTLTMDTLDLDMDFDISKLAGEPLMVVGKGLQVLPEGSALSPLAELQVDLGKVEFWAQDPFFGIDIKAGEIDLGSADLSSLFGGLSQAFADLSGALVDNVVGFATTVLEPLVAVVGGEALEKALMSLEVDQEIGIPELIPGQSPGAITVQAKLSTVAFTSAGANVSLTGAAVSEKVVDRDPLGSILRDGCLKADAPAYSLPQQGALEFALGLDLLNELVYSLWWNGGLNLAVDASDLGDLGDLGITEATITLNPLLPPIFDDCNSKGTLKMQIGDANLDVHVLLGDVPVDFKAWLTAEIDVGIVANGQELGVKVNGVSLFEIQLYDVSGGFEGNEGALKALIENVLLEKLLGQLTSGALGTFPLPQFNIGGLIPGVEGDIVLELGQLNVKKIGGFIQVEGALQ